MLEQKSERLISLDVFRGITIAGMILVNNPGSWGNIYPALKHADWHGCTPTDLIFPFFLFIVGVAITISLSKKKEKGESHTKIMLQVAKRSLLLFLLGMILASYPFGLLFSHNFDISNVRIPGVLQRIALVYFVAAFIFLKFDIKWQAIIAAIFLFIYWFVMTLIPVPGFGMPNLDIPIMINEVTKLAFAPNLAGWIDYNLLGSHLWRASKVWDPEGLLSTVPAISTAISGIMLGHLLRSKIEPMTRVVWMFVFGNLGIMLGVIWDMWFPFNKGLWTSSYVLYTSGMALHFFALCYFLIDIKGYTWWTKPFVVYGMNAITVFFLTGIMARTFGLIKVTNAEGNIVSLHNFLYNILFVPYMSPINASLAWALLYVTVWLGILWILYWKKIFIKV
ncbi:MAG: DUF5009 domain-containing protein [Chlorobiaceae bacterium]|nr:DUF5009 domain-containing protein [Chlorobiaceae bacterium]MBA4310014.1 DUF5009 domain-containing protein [Chlorobiaceae bacterium]